MYEILYEKRVLKDLDKISDRDVERILDVVRNLSHNPFPAGTKKLSGKSGLYRIRQGDYRIIYTVDHKGRSIQIVVVRHRKDVYKELGG